MPLTSADLLARMNDIQHCAIIYAACQAPASKSNIIYVFLLLKFPFYEAALKI